jgi:integrase
MRSERPIARTNPSGEKVWLARWTTRDGKKRVGYPPDIRGTYKLKRDAQAAIHASYEREAQGPAMPGTVGSYFETWAKHHPRMPRTDKTNASRIKAVLDVKVDGAPLRDWPFADLRRRHATALVDHMLREQGRAYTGAQGILRSLSAMTEDAITDEVALSNPFRGVKVRANDPRVVKQIRAVRVWSWREMHEFARACAAAPGGHGSVVAAHKLVYAEVMVRLLSDCGLRAGELLALHRADLDVANGVLMVQRSVSDGVLLDGTKADRLRGLVQGRDDVGREVPVPPALLAMMVGMPRRIDTPLLFPAPLGGLWDYSNWMSTVWYPGCAASGGDPRPHELRHSFVSHMRAAGVDDADLAEITGHTVLTMVARYSHALGRSHAAIREAVGA